jgi:hypothetical protein
VTRMFVLVVVALATLSPILALPVAAPAQTLPTLDTVFDASVTLPQPANIKVDPLLQPVVDALLEKSPTLRRQWRAIGATRIVRVSLISSSLLRDATNARARTEVSRYESGAIGAVVELPTGVDITELLPHELEHVLEQVEGVDLPALAKRRASGVQQVGRGVYETERARGAGLMALREVHGELDPAMSAAVRGLKRVWKALTPDGASAIEAVRKGAPTRSATGTNGAAPPPAADKRQ